MMDHYILVGQTTVPVEDQDFIEWARWFETADRVVFKSYAFGGLVWVSTLFLGLDHSFRFDEDDRDPPILFETMAFWDGAGYEQERCSTWMEAEAMHHRMVADVQRPAAFWAFLKRTWRETLWTMRLRFRALVGDGPNGDGRYLRRTQRARAQSVDGALNEGSYCSATLPAAALHRSVGVRKCRRKTGSCNHGTPESNLCGLRENRR
jgi:hypothetical protein